MQSFFNRAILCDYNTLFLVEINDSFSDFQQNIMYTYIDTLLSYKNEKYKEYERKIVDKVKTKEYLNSCIIFIYEQKNKDNISFLNEIKKFETSTIGYNDPGNTSKLLKHNFYNNVENITFRRLQNGKTQR
jgi:hypothetical protein